MTKRLFLITLSLFVGVALFYAPSCLFDYVNLDDHSYTFRCPFVCTGFSFSNLVEAFCRLRWAAIWMPLTYTSYMLDISLLPTPFAHHLTNILLHALNAVLFLALLLTVLRLKKIEVSSAHLILCILATLIWALHPLRLESVAWISGRKELLWCTFTLVGLVTWLHARPRLTLLACALACLSKPTAICFPFLAWTLSQLVTPPTTETSRLSFKSLRPYTPFLICSLITGIIAILSHRAPENYILLPQTSSWALHLVNALATIGISIFQIFIPLSLHVDVRTLPETPLTSTLIPAMLGWCILAGALFLSRKQPRKLLLCVLFFLVALAPTLGLFGSFGRSPRADRWTYVPTLALSLSCVLIGLRLSSRLRTGILLFFILTFATISFTHLFDWKNDLSLWSRVLICDASHPRAHAHVARALILKPNRTRLAFEHFRQSLATAWNESVAIEFLFHLSQILQQDSPLTQPTDLAELKTLAKRIKHQWVQAAKKSNGQHAVQLDRASFFYEALGQCAFTEKNWKDAIQNFETALSYRKTLRTQAQRRGGGEVPADDATRLACARAYRKAAYAHTNASHQERILLEEKARDLLVSLVPPSGECPEGVRPQIHEQAKRELYELEHEH